VILVTRQNRPTLLRVRVRLKLKNASLLIWNDLPQEFIDKAILSLVQFERDFNRVLLQLADTLTLSLNAKRAADIH